MLVDPFQLYLIRLSRLFVVRVAEAAYEEYRWMCFVVFVVS